jgi:hypothetical protein
MLLILICHIFLILILSFLHLLTCVYIIWATYPALLFSNFVEEKT